VNTENILVPFGIYSSSLKPLYHAFALAERVKSKIFVLFFKNENLTQNHTTPLEKACLEMIHSACEEGMAVSFHIATGRIEVELLKFIKTEYIDLIVVGAGDTEMESAIKGITPGVSIQIVKVKGKNNINFI
jgi:K+-sensing histidine kinase KdpD